jgi:D-lyxose ketol-isomerase
LIDKWVEIHFNNVPTGWLLKRRDVEHAKNRALEMLQASGIVLSDDQTIEITDFGKNDYEKIGLGLIIRINEPEYASKWLTILPGQSCPNHYHKKIKETFFIMAGDVNMSMDGKVLEMKPGHRVTLPPGTWHKFSSENGAVIEEITTHQIPDDSYFEDPEIERYVTIEDG